MVEVIGTVGELSVAHRDKKRQEEGTKEKTTIYRLSAGYSLEISRMPWNTSRVASL